MPVTRRTFQRLMGGAFLLTAEIREAAAQGMVGVALQPFAAQVRRIIAALEAIGEPLNPADKAALEQAFADADEARAVRSIQQVLDRYVLLHVDINPESRVSVTRGAAPAELVEQGWRTFLVKVVNEAADTTVLKVTSP